MAGWTNSKGTSSGGGGGGGRGSGGRGFTPHLNPSLFTHGGTSAGAAGPGPGGGGGGGGGGRFVGGRSRGRPPQQPHYRYRRVGAADREPPLVPLSERQAASFDDDDEPEVVFQPAPPVFHRETPPRVPLPEHQAASSTSSSRRTRRTRPISTMDKSPAPGTAAPPSAREADDKANRNAANFECNVCFDMAAEPVVTKCGHLFCWECLYQWLHVHSHHRECPVCKGQVAEDAVIPIYGRGGSAASVDNAPPRPTGARVESSRQQQQRRRQRASLPPLFDFPRLSNMRFPSIREAMMHTIEGMEMDLSDALMDRSDAFSYLDDGEFYPEVNAFDMEVDQYGDLDDELYESGFGWGGVTLFGPGTEVGNGSSSRAHTDMINNRDNAVGTTTGGYHHHHHHQEFGYSGVRPNNNRGRRGRRNRTRVSADHLSTDDPVMVTRSSSGFIHSNNGGGPNDIAGTAVRTNGSLSGWTERRGRSNRNSNSGGGRGGMQDSRRQRTDYN